MNYEIYKQILQPSCILLRERKCNLRAFAKSFASFVLSPRNVLAPVIVFG